jgi:hypothetical protein
VWRLRDDGDELGGGGLALAWRELVSNSAGRGLGWRR